MFLSLDTIANNTCTFTLEKYSSIASTEEEEPTYFTVDMFVIGEWYLYNKVSYELRTSPTQRWLLDTAALMSSS